MQWLTRSGLAWSGLAVFGALAAEPLACGSGSNANSGAGGQAATAGAGGASQAQSSSPASSASQAQSASSASSSSSSSSTSASASQSSSGSASSSGSGSPCGTCPMGYSCGSANGIAVCRNQQSDIPLFSEIVLVLMENTTLATLQAAESNNGAPNLAAMTKAYATGSDYHGVAHPSLPNYIALTSGDTQGIGCDCKAAPNQGACNLISCNKLLGDCSCVQKAQNLADQLDANKLSWRAFGEDMGQPCNLGDGNGYAVRHLPFLYYDDVQSDAARCQSRVVDLSGFDPNNPPAFAFIAPNLTHDMHDPFPAGPQNIMNGDAWVGPFVTSVTGAKAFKQGGLLVVVWDEDDNSGGILNSDDPVPIFVISPLAKQGGFASSVKADHYALLATVEDGLGLGRLGQADKAAPLGDYFPSQ